MSQDTPSLERQVLLDCLRALWEPDALEAARAGAGQAGFDWTAFQRAVSREYLAPLVYHVAGGKGMLPAEVEAELRSAYYALAGHNSVLLHELERVLGALHAAGVPTLLLKGAAFLFTTYPSVGLRPMVDVDMLVPPERVEAAEAALVDLGYTATLADPWPGFTWRYRNAMGYSRPSGSIAPHAVGLHTRLYDVPFTYRIPLAAWFEQALPLPDAGPGARIPAAEDHLVYLCGHIALHHQYAAGLQRTLDLALLIRWAGTGLDWDGVAARAGAWRLVIPAQRALGQLARTWPGVVPTAALGQIDALQATGAERRVHAWVTERPRTPTADTLLALATLPGLGRRIGFLAEAAFPSPSYMAERYCPEHPRRWPWAYFSRAWMAVKALVRRQGGKTAE